MARVVTVAGIPIGDPNRIVIMGGPCAVESRDQMMRTAEKVKKAGADILRGGAYKPRSVGGTWEGLQEEGLKYLVEAREQFGLPIVTEILDPRHVTMFKEYGVDLFQLGARNATNQVLLKEVGAAQVPVLYKNGPGTTHAEWMGALSHITKARGSTDNIILCMRGRNIGNEIGRNSIDMVAMAHYIQTHEYPFIVDPSHGTGKRKLVRPVTLGALMMGADGILIESHHDPESAITDGPQSILPGELEILIEQAREVRDFYLKLNADYVKRMKLVQMPRKVTIYFKADDLAMIQEELGLVRAKPYALAEVNLLEAHVDAAPIGNLVRRGYALGKLHRMGEEQNAPIGISLQREDAPKMLISPFSADVVRARGKKTLDEIGQFGSRVEFIRRYPSDPIADAFATYAKVAPETRLVLYKK